jgi:hypothetical protein
MEPSKEPSQASSQPLQDARLLALQLRVALRADELARIMGIGVGQSFELWRHAETEIWASVTPEELGVRSTDASRPAPQD